MVWQNRNKKRNKNWFRKLLLFVLVASCHFCFTFSAREVALGDTHGMDLGQTFPGAHLIQVGGGPWRFVFRFRAA